MARGSLSKARATEMILKAFPESFVYEKEIRLPFQEDGEDIQLKCVLTCAKNNVEKNGDIVVPGQDKGEINFTDNINNKKVIEPTQEEKDNVKKLMETFGL